MGCLGGIGELIMKSDGERSLLVVKEGVMKYHGGIMIPEVPAKGEKAEKGLIEEAGKTLREYICTFISKIEEGVGQELPIGCNLHLWVVRWAAIGYSRYAGGKDGRTAYERLRGRAYKSVVAPRGEKVWYKELRGSIERKNKAETEWLKGIWLGPATGSSETRIGTAAGVVRANAIKRFDASQKWDLQAILDMQGTPQRPNPNKLGIHIPIKIRLELAVEVEMPEMKPARAEDTPKRSYLKKYHFEEHGYTVDCEGCARLAAGMDAKPHREEYTKRMYEELGKTEKGRKWMENVEERIGEYLENKVEEEDERNKAQSKEGLAGQNGISPGELGETETEETPAEHDEEDGLTLEEFGKNKKEERDASGTSSAGVHPGERGGKKANTKSEETEVEGRAMGEKGDKRSASEKETETRKPKPRAE